MSWLWNPQGDASHTRNTAPGEKLVPDPSIPNRMETTKSANKPFLAYKEYKDKQEQDHKAWMERKIERDAKVARGEKVGPEERDPTAQEEVGILGLLKFLVYVLIIIALAGKFFTGSFTWEYDGKWTRLKTYWPTNQRLFSEGLLAQFDGTDINKPLYLAIDHDVYDVSSNRRTYGPGGSYHHMAGVDAARAFGTGCFLTHRTHDLRGLTDREMKGVQHWKKFFAEHKDYTKVGKVLHPPIDPASEIPEHCNPQDADSDNPRKQSKENPRTSQKQPKQGQRKREEL